MLTPAPCCGGLQTPQGKPDLERTDASSRTLPYTRGPSAPPKGRSQPGGVPDAGAALQALLHEVVEVGGEAAVVGVGWRVAVGGPGGAGGQALAQARVGCRARGAHGQLLGGDGAGVQQAGHGAVQFLQQHLGRTEPGPGWKGAPGRPTEFLHRYTFPNAQT